MKYHVTTPSVFVIIIRVCINHLRLFVRTDAVDINVVDIDVVNVDVIDIERIQDYLKELDGWLPADFHGR